MALQISPERVPPTNTKFSGVASEYIPSIFAKIAQLCFEANFKPPNAMLLSTNPVGMAPSATIVVYSSTFAFVTK
jgi:hypothetical protein